jgi:quinol monooxygenase YgiN
MAKAFVLTATNLALLVASSVLTGLFIGRWNSTKAKAPSPSDGTFVLLVNMKFISLDLRNKFLEWIEPVCKDVIENESPTGSRGSTQTTLSYQVAISDKDPLMVVVLERYSDKENGYLTVHRSGGEFLKFRQLLKGMQEKGEVEINGESYIETSLGYV